MLGEPVKRLRELSQPPAGSRNPPVWTHRVLRRGGESAGDNLRFETAPECRYFVRKPFRAEKPCDQRAKSQSECPRFRHGQGAGDKDAGRAIGEAGPERDLAIVAEAARATIGTTAAAEEGKCVYGAQVARRELQGVAGADDLSKLAVQIRAPDTRRTVA